MLLPGALAVLFMAGCWLYCLTDVALTPAAAFRGFPKAAWVCIIAVTFIAGAAAWLIARRSLGGGSGPYAHATGGVPHSSGDTDYPDLLRRTAADEAIERHPAGRFRRPGSARRNVPKGPDDDPDFLLDLDRLIEGSPDTGEDR